ncbi:vWA domain-containing protein [Litoribacillus peritrichatus]|uniref:VWFA domain-containing protein n=1 Tax=Litoribacillus peritrichatus TaxID=718191 RepID=A0ABP7MWP2_9GAMM
MKTLIKNLAVAVGLSAFCNTNLLANEPVITVKSKSEYSAPIIVIRSKYDFEKSISLKLKTDPSLDASDILIRTISKFGMVDANGIKIVSGFDIDQSNNIIVAFSGGTSEIIQTSGNPSQLNIVASFRDSSGQFVSPPPDSVAVYSMSGEKLCFDYKTVQQAPPKIGIALLLDRSGSMAGNIDAVKSTANNFLNSLPPHALCAVGSFNSDLTYGHKNYQQCNGGGFGFENIEASGGTDIFKALSSAYSDLSGSYFNGYQKAAIVITDGYTVNDAKVKAELLANKNGILTFVYFIGGNHKDDLEGITDHFISQGGNVRQSLSHYFSAIGLAYKSQKVLSVKPCSGGAHATP